MGSKKINMGAIDSLLGEKNEEEVVKPTKPTKKPVGRPKEEDYEARTYRVRKDLAAKLRIISQKEGRLQKDILDFALESAISRYEKKHGVIDITKDYEQSSIKELF